MNFKLARELEENGFPKKGCNWDYSHEHDKGQVLYFPSLSELIEACGDDFNILVRGKDGFWYAESEQGKTPTEAVARLWLVINKTA